MREAIFFSFFSLYLLGLGSNFVLCSSFSLLNNVAFARYARNVNARAQLRSFWARCCCCSPIYIYLYSKREKERERKKLDVDDVVFGWERPPLAVGEKNERKVPPFTKHTKGGDSIVSFSRGEMRLFRVNFFLFFQTSLSLLCVLCADMKNVFLLLLTSNTNHT